MYGKLIEFHEQKGHCNVPHAYKIEGINLGSWCSNQKQAHKNDNLSPDKVARLDILGFVWDSLEAFWEEGFSALETYKKAKGHCNVPAIYEQKEVRLGAWCHRQRQKYKKGNLSPDKVSRLDVLGFVFDVFEALWEEGFSALETYKKKEGHCNVPKHYKIDDLNLGAWCNNQKKLLRNGTIPPNRRDLLKQLGLTW